MNAAAKRLAKRMTGVLADAMATTRRMAEQMAVP